MEKTFGTFNVNSVRSRLPILERWFQSVRPQVLCLQETKTQDDGFPLEFFRNQGYSVVFKGQKSYNGVAICSLCPPDSVINGFDDGKEESFDTRVIAGLFGDLWVLNTYVPQGKSIDHQDYLVKQEFLTRTGAMINRLRASGKEVLWVGDLNVAPTEIDVTNPKTKKNHVCYHSAIRDLFQKVRLDMVDVFRKHRPGPGEYTFFDYRVKDSLERNIGWRIDHVLATPALAEKSKDSWVDRNPRSWDRPSDHTALLAVFDL